VKFDRADSEKGLAEKKKKKKGLVLEVTASLQRGKKRRAKGGGEWLFSSERVGYILM